MGDVIYLPTSYDFKYIDYIYVWVTLYFTTEIQTDIVYFI